MVDRTDPNADDFQRATSLTITDELGREFTTADGGFDDLTDDEYAKFVSFLKDAISTTGYLELDTGDGTTVIFDTSRIITIQLNS